MIPQATPIYSLTPADRDAMFALLHRCFDGVTRESFEEDLNDKTLSIQLRDSTGLLQGFSTLAFYPTTDPRGQTATIACSGDTIVAPEAWGSSALSRAWIDVALRWHSLHGKGELYWLLITSGYRTYRFLPVFFNLFYPHHRRPTPTDTAQWMHQLAANRWGDAYQPDKGIVQFNSPQRLRGTLADVPDKRSHDPHVRHFLSLNPGHAEGDELVSICQLSYDNLTRAGQRMVGTPALPDIPACELAR